IGYKNEKYLHFGRAAARLDDAVNFIPSRLSAVLLIAAAGLCRQNPGNAYRIWRRDRKQTVPFEA
ncbi:MAG: cobalamin biosynthesis protein, partial [Erysipelotrichaceae bacterium]|nr:cobalamin biosynthesis protein [Erysipelotrichaceae bacterium]